MNLISGLKNNKESALSLLIDMHAKHAFDFAYSIMKNTEEAEDIVQDVFIKLWDYRTQLDENSDVLKLIYTITKRLCFNKLRKSYFKSKIFEIEEAILSIDNNYKEDYLSKEIAFLEEQIIQKLPEQQRKVYLLSRKEGKSYEEISTELQISPNTVRNHIVQALKTLKFYFKKFGYLFFLHFFSF